MSVSTPFAPLSRAAELLVRAALPMAALVLAALVLDGLRVAGAHRVAQLGARAVLLAYLMAGIANLPRFPRALRGPATRARADCWLLDMWTLVAVLVMAVTAVEGPIFPLI